jgi:hypothetical protein
LWTIVDCCGLLRTVNLNLGFTGKVFDWNDGKFWCIVIDSGPLADAVLGVSGLGVVNFDKGYLNSGRTGGGFFFMS